MNTPAWHTVWTRRKWTAMQCTDQKTELIARAETKWYGKRDVQFNEGRQRASGRVLWVSTAAFAASNNGN